MASYHPYYSGPTEISNLHSAAIAIRNRADKALIRQNPRRLFLFLVS